MGIRFTRPTLPPDSLKKVQGLASAAVASSSLSSPDRLETFFCEASRWVHAGSVHDLAPWQRGSVVFLEDSDRTAIAAAGRQALRAFHRPNLAYAACHGALVAWPEIWTCPSGELMHALRSVDARGVDSCVDGLTCAVGAIAWAMVQSDLTARLKGELYSDIWQRCHQPTLTTRVIHGEPSQTQQACRQGMSSFVHIMRGTFQTEHQRQLWVHVLCAVSGELQSETPGSAHPHTLAVIFQSVR